MSEISEKAFVARNAVFEALGGVRYHIDNLENGLLLVTPGKGEAALCRLEDAIRAYMKEVEG